MLNAFIETGEPMLYRGDEMRPLLDHGSEVISMLYHGVEVIRVNSITLEAYLCSWADRNRLVLGLLAEGKGSTTKEQPAIQAENGILRKPHALVEVGSYSEAKISP